MEMILERLIALNTRQTKEQTRAFIKECPLRDYDELTRSPRLKQMAERINSTTDDEEQRKLKSWLPFRCPHYTQFRDDYRDREHIVAESFTWQTCIDIDDPELVEKANEMSERLDIEAGGQWQGLMLHKDYSIRRKLHIDIRLPIGMTVPEAQREYCKALGVECDTSCFTPERFIYISPADFEIYRADGWYQQLSEDEIALRRKAYTDRGLSIDGRTEDGSYYDPEGDTCVAEATEGRYPGEFKGVAYTSLISEFWRRTGGEPAEGERNKRLHQLAANLRAICDNSEEWLLEVMPRFGLSEAEMKSIIHSACKEPTKGSRLIDQIVNALEMGISSDEIEDAEAVAAETGVKVNVKALPIGLKESLAGVPVSMHMPVLCGVLPIAAAYADQVQIQYCDGNLQHLGLMSIIRGEQASNKSVVKNAVDVWKRQFDEEDALARKREEEWKERKKGRKANEKAPEDPKVLIRMVPVTVSCSTLLKRFKNAQGHTIYSFGEELDTLRKTNGAGSWSSKYDIYRLSFDKGEWGQDYNSDAAESGVVKVAYNWTMLGTNGAMRKCFKSDNIENGLSSRILVAEMPDSSFSKMPKFGRRSTEDEARIQEAVTRLRSYSGLVDTPRLRKAIEEWVEQKRIEAAKDIDHVKDTYRKRAAVIGFRCGVIFHLLSGRDKETKACLEFALMMADYCLSQQIKAFGEALQNQYVDAHEECQRYGANHSVFDQLAPTFTIDDLRALKRGYCSETAMRVIISRWMRDGWISKTDRHHWTKNVTK
ncbi:DUF3987 domain-containing protein [Prevotella sp. ne3005]|uniref:DUF3987 domain-containing protein n=1 Tax=Prevotella sp. ne3005 TaxID=1761887 RepID=UPI000B8A12E3|nr:DUF3987 domain-containing protein [Prevotella sp. ne3005]